MRLGKRSFLTILVVLLLLGTALPFAALQAQNQTTVLSVAIPEWMGNYFPPETLARFEADHAGVKVNVVKLSDEMNYPPAAYEPDKYFEGTAKYVGKADVLSINSYNLTTEGTRAGYFLDLAPLTRGDASLNADDFVSGAWQAFQWDGGVWAVPISFDVVILSYDPAAFDKAGIPYPNGKWTIDDLADAARKLTVKDADGKITTPGIVAWNDGPLFRSASGETFVDPESSPSVPRFDKPGLIHLVEVWSKLQDEGMFNFQGDLNAVPLRVGQSFDIARNMGNSEKPRNGSLLPGGKAGLSVDGFAVSAGTQYPELAYALVKYITSEPKIVSRYFGFAPARKSLANADPGSDTPVYKPKFTPENQAALDEALANALPPSEYRFVEYVRQALGEMQEKKIDARTALQNAEKKAAAALQMAAEKRNAKAVVVATPVPTPVLKEGEISLKFNMMAYISPMPNHELWDQVIKDFTSTDPQVKNIALDAGFGAMPNELADKFDCFAVPGNFVSFMSEENLLPLDSLMSADSSFDKNDIIGNSLAQLQRNNKTWGLPLYIQPQVLRYNAEAFARAGLKAPDSDWSIDTFNDALKALKVQPGDAAPFVPRQYGSAYLLMLIAAYGGLPLDYRTTPVTVNFTEPATMDAMRQVLDLARKGYIKYQKLATTGGGGGGPNRFTDPIYTDSLSMLNYYQAKYPGAEKNPYKLIGYPKGTRFAPASYDIGAGYISAKSASPEACYRWISTLSRHPELFWAMPARRSALDSPGVESQGPDIAAFYKGFDKALQDPSVLIVPAQFGSVGDYVLQYFLNRAFDHYVLDNADLEVELKEAETLAKAYQECIANIPPNTTATTPKALQAYYKQFTDCAVKVDPTLKSLFGEQQ